MSNSDKTTLVGKRAVVTGAGRGIGRSIALALAEAGADVAVSARTANDIEALVAEIRATGRQGVGVTCDVTVPEQVQQMMMAVTEGLGGIDILVNNAGNAGSHKFLNHPDELWQRMLAVNLTSIYYVTKAFVPMLIDQRSGRIINIASIASRVGGQYIAAYTAAKHGALGLTRALAVELLPYNITVNAICPGYIATEMVKAVPKDVLERNILPLIPLGRLGEPEEIARCVVFLASDDAGLITGSTLSANGGQYFA